jgi:hypothetical protein
MEQKDRLKKTKKANYKNTESKKRKTVQSKEMRYKNADDLYE